MMRRLLATVAAISLWSGIASAQGVQGTSALTLKAPSATILTSGTAQTYTTPAGALYLTVEMRGGGAGGAGSGTTPGVVSGQTASTFTDSGSIVLSAGAGGIPTTTTPGTGGTTSGCDVNLTGQAGTAPNLLTATQQGGRGGGAGGGVPPTAAATAGGNAAANTGGGGSGASDAGTVAPGAGGGEGGYCFKLIATPSATFTYTVGAGSSGGTLGTSGAAGGNGAAGLIKVVAYFQ